MVYTGPDYDARFGIILPGLSLALFPRTMTASAINTLLQYYPHLAHYFSESDGGGGDGGGGTEGTGQYVPLPWWNVTPISVNEIVNGELDRLNVPVVIS